MVHLITGGSGSGKSAYAEDMLLRYGEESTDKAGGCDSNTRPYLYVATMIPYGEETGRKIKRHRQMRAGKGFQTLECYTDLMGLEVPVNRGILLECVSNLTANEFYLPDGSMRNREETLKTILRGIKHLEEETPHLVIVTNEIHSDVNDYSDETRKYIELLGTINQRIAGMADKITEVVYGIPIEMKG